MALRTTTYRECDRCNVEVDDAHHSRDGWAELTLTAMPLRGADDLRRATTGPLIGVTKDYVDNPHIIPGRVPLPPTVIIPQRLLCPACSQQLQWWYGAPKEAHGGTPEG
jgi:hypothetical protein